MHLHLLTSELQRKEETMTRQCWMQAHQLTKFAQFLEEHPAFSPILI